MTSLWRRGTGFGSMADPTNIIVDWPIASNFGWGLRGLGCALNWPGVAVSAHPQLEATLPPGDNRQPLLNDRIQRSRTLQNHIATMPEVTKANEPVLVALGNNLEAQPSMARRLRGTPHVACPVFEEIDIVRANIERLKEYDLVVVASRWNQEVLNDLGVRAELCHEGVDPVIFNPSVRKRQGDGKFRVFSGGKAEWRKGQDLVIKAFAEFAKTHDDAVLVASWGSPWAGLARTFEGKWEHGAPPGLHINRPNWHAWVQRAGIKPHQFEWVEPRVNWQMPEVYGGVDVAVFPNRCEGGTNFVAMEAMACGVPVVLNDAFGQRDLMGAFHRGNNVDEVVAALYYEHENRRQVVPVLSEYWTWARHCEELAGIIRNA